ncbi:MAG: CPBP family intramembrane glutamic endopeptidase [Planctomycetota bacterium]
MKNKSHIKAARIIESAFIIFLFAGHVHLLTLDSADIQEIVISALIVVLALSFGLSPLTKHIRSRRHLWITLTALAGAFWIFSFFRYTGFLQWPLGRPDGLKQYVWLLYCHLILSIMVLSLVLLTSYLTRADIAVKWGGFKRLLNHDLGTVWLILIALGTWLWALHVIMMYRPQLEDPLIVLVAICLAKATLTGTTEEICYRGIVQPIAIRHFGLPVGMILQGCLYTAFHIHLGAAVFPKPFFLAAVMSLGLIFGMVSYRTKGIGWAILIHTAISVVVEWRNLC